MQISVPVAGTPSPKGGAVRPANVRGQTVRNNGARAQKASVVLSFFLNSDDVHGVLFCGKIFLISPSIGESTCGITAKCLI